MSIPRFLTGVALVALPALLAVPAQAQTGQIVGVVTDGQSGAPLSEVQVYIPGTGLGALTRQDGRYILLNVAPGTYELTGERIGLGSVSQQVTVAAGQTLQADFTMASVALGLDEIIVTGTAGASRRREIGNVVSQLNTVDVPDAPLNVSDMLQGAAPGLELYGGGAIGQSKIIRLRGVNSAVLNDHPIIYVDGVRIRSNPFPDANPPDRRGGRSGNIAVSPLDQINPNDIERIEVIKGSAATTLYGTEASGGVIQVFTKQGREGAPTWTAEVQTGTQWSRAFGVDDSGPSYQGETDVSYNFMEHWLCTGILECGQYANQAYNQDYLLSVRGGTSDVSYFVSGSFGDAQGYQTNDSEKAYTTRANLTFSPADDLQIQWNTMYSNSMQTHTGGQNNAQGITLNAFRQERNYFGTGDPAALNELMDQKIAEDVERFTTGMTLTYSPITDLTNRFVVGYDWGSREHRNLRPYGWMQTPQGKLLNNTFQNRVLSLDYVGSYSLDIMDQLRANISWGGQAVGDDVRSIEGFGENFPGAADPTINSAASTISFEGRTKVWNSGFFFQNVFDISNKYFLTTGVRIDGNSTFGEGFGLAAYPKASFSWILSDESFYPDIGEMKVRFAYGQSGRAPGPFDKVRTWSPQGLAGVPAFVPANVGNADIGPEVTTEMEGGFDASFIDNRLSVGFTYYDQVTDDALFGIPQLPSGGFSSSQLTNIGKLGNKGLELEVNATVVQMDDWGVDLGLTYSWNESEILELNDPSLENSYRKVGHPIRPVTNELISNPTAIANSNSDVIFCQPTMPCWQGQGTSASQYFYGSNLPTTFINPSITVRAPGGITLAARGEYKGNFYMNEQVFAIGRSVRSPLCYPYYVTPGTSNELKPDIPAIWYARCNRADSEGYVWDATFFKLRSVSANIPMNFMFPERFNTTMLTIALNNSYLWMKEMPFMDPETMGDPAGSGPQRAFNFEETVPPPISFRISLRVTF